MTAAPKSRRRKPAPKAPRRLAPDPFTDRAVKILGKAAHARLVVAGLQVVDAKLLGELDVEMERLARSLGAARDRIGVLEHSEVVAAEVPGLKAEIRKLRRAVRALGGEP